MHRAVVSTKDMEKITPLPDDLKRFKTLELFIYPANLYDRNKLKKRFDAVFKKARDIKIPNNIDIDDMMNEMNDAIL